MWVMERLRAYLKTLSPPEQAKYAERSGTTIGYLRKVLSVATSVPAQPAPQPAARSQMRRARRTG